MTPVRAHDLILLDNPVALLTGQEPEWVRAALTETPWVVVRRAIAAPGHLAVGVRGTLRDQRHALELAPAATIEVVRPEDLRPPAGACPSDTPAMTALRAAVPLLDGFGHRWGPTGSAGFELATRRPTTTHGSDLDLVVRVPVLPPAKHIAALARQLGALGARVDCQLDTNRGAVALAELARSPERVLFRTLTGPHLVAFEDVVTR
jgi:phosphoribosyl-dephospho-CoA transferase